jgi:hypothetical protein
MVPPKLEKLLGYLIPPACREEVLGDLHERHEQWPLWLFETVVTIPYVVESRIRRTSDSLVLLMQGSVMYSAWMAIAMYLDSRFLAAPLAFLRMALPPLIVLLVLIFADAYANPQKLWRLRPVTSALAGFALAYLAQSWLRINCPELALPRTILLYGMAFALPLVAALRMLYLPFPDVPRSAGVPAHWLKQDPVGMPPVFWMIIAIVGIILLAIR